jgi:hypothetical protein
MAKPDFQTMARAELILNRTLSYQATVAVHALKDSLNLDVKELRLTVAPVRADRPGAYSVTCTIATHLCAQLDTVGRQGGDEFVILLSEVSDAQDAVVSVDKILLALSAPHYVDQHDLHLTVSVGIVIYSDDRMDAGTLMTNADFAMYYAKESGRDRLAR